MGKGWRLVNESFRMVLVLTVIAMVASGLLALVYGPTSAIIEENAARALESSVLEVLPGTAKVNIIRVNPNELGEFDSRTMKEKEQKTSIIYQGVDASGKNVGFAYVGEANGYGGVVRVLVGVAETTHQILAMKVLEHTETPGLGSRIEEESFRKQFVGKTQADAIAVGRDINAISGATVSSNAATNAVREGFGQAAVAYKGGK